MLDAVAAVDAVSPGSSVVENDFQSGNFLLQVSDVGCEGFFLFCFTNVPVFLLFPSWLVVVDGCFW